MKTRLNLTIEDDLLAHAKAYAAKKGTSVSELVEHYFKSIARPGKKKNILRLVEDLERSPIADLSDLKEGYYLAQREKHGF